MRNSSDGLGGAAGAEEEVAADGVPLVTEVRRPGHVGDRVQHREPGVRAEGAAVGDGPVDLDRRVVAGRREQVVEPGDARPVGVLGTAGARVAGGDGGLHRVDPDGLTRPSDSARASAARPRRISRWSQRARSWSSSSTGSPDGVVRAWKREAWSSSRACSPCTSASDGARAASIRESRSASRQRSVRIHDVPAVAAYPSL